MVCPRPASLAVSCLKPKSDQTCDKRWDRCPSKKARYTARLAYDPSVEPVHAVDGSSFLDIFLSPLPEKRKAPNWRIVHGPDMPPWSKPAWVGPKDHRTGSRVLKVLLFVLRTLGRELIRVLAFWPIAHIRFASRNDMRSAQWDRHWVV